MAYDKNTVSKAVKSALEAGKGKRKFTQSVEVAINFNDVDFKKPENRVNLDIPLPYAAKRMKIAIFADGQAATDAKAVADLVITGPEIPSYVTDKAKQALLLECATLATTPLMPVVGKQLGQVLSAKGRLPKPIMPNSNLKDLVESVRRSVTLRTKGKMLPVVHCIVGREDMVPEQVVENVQAVLEAVMRKFSENQIPRVFIKTTMGPAVRI